MIEITQEKFDELLNDEKERNWKVKKIIEDHGGYDNCPQHVKDMIDKRIGIQRGEKIFLNQL